MKVKQVSISICWLTLILLFGVTVPVISYDYSIESLQSIIKRSTDVVEVEVIEIKQSIDEHNAPIRIVILKVNELLVGKSVDPIITLQFPILDYEGTHRPLTPKFKTGEKAILHLKKLNDNTFTVLGHDQGKYEITGPTIEGKTISAKHFKQQIKEVYAGRSNLIDIPEHRKIPGFAKG
jgi:hypothetical protein